TKEELNQHIQRLLACAEELNKSRLVFISLSYGQYRLNISVMVYRSTEWQIKNEPDLVWDTLTQDNTIDQLPELVTKMERLAKGEQK
ncbi:MAG: hypothetical protein WC389_10530, partial [Lutibacter sp.]